MPGHDDLLLEQIDIGIVRDFVTIDPKVLRCRQGVVAVHQEDHRCRPEFPSGILRQESAPCRWMEGSSWPMADGMKVRARNKNGR